MAGSALGHQAVIPGILKPLNFKTQPETDAQNKCQDWKVQYESSLTNWPKQTLLINGRSLTDTSGTTAKDRFNGMIETGTGRNQR